MKKLLLIAFLGACTEIKTDLSQPPLTEPKPVVEADECVLPDSLLFEERLFTHLNGDPFIVFFNQTNPSIEAALQLAASLGEGATAYNSGFDPLPCLVNGEGPLNCSASGWLILDFGSPELNQEFINRCLQPTP